MDNKNHNLEDFLRKKLGEFDDSNDGWDKPDPEVWNSAKAEIPVFGNAKPFALKGLLIGGFCAILFFLGGYIHHLQKENKDLKIALNNQKEQLDDIARTVATLTEKRSKETAEWNSQNEKLERENNKIFKQKDDLENIIQKQEKTIASQKNNIQAKGISKTPGFLNAKNNIPLPSETQVVDNLKKEKNPELQNIAVLSLKTFETTPSQFPILKTPIIPISAPKKTFNKFEIGYEYGIPNIKIQSKRAFDDLKATSEGLTNEVFNGKSHGVYFAFSPKQNLFIKTGIRKASFDIKQTYKTGLFYDKSKEYIKDDGKIGNDFDLNLNTSYSDQRSTIAITVPSDVNLKSDDVLFFTIYENQNIESYQVPLGLQYFIGNQRFSWFMEGGVQWNKLVFSNYQLKTIVEDSKSKEFVVDKIEFDSDSFSKQFLSVYGGLGFNYQLTTHWQLRTTYLVNYILINKQSTDFSKADLTSRSFNMSLNYRF